MAEEILPGAAERAATLLADITEQRWEQAISGFNQRMARALDARRLAAVWARVVDTADAYEGMGEPARRHPAQPRGQAGEIRRDPAALEGLHGHIDAMLRAASH
jgi:hypothetical protein